MILTALHIDSSYLTFVIDSITRVICKSQGFKRYRVDTAMCLTLKYNIDLEVTLVKDALYTLSHGTFHVCQVS